MSNRDIARLTFISIGICALIQSIPVMSNLAWTLGEYIHNEWWSRQFGIRYYKYSPLGAFWGGVIRTFPLLLYCLVGCGLILGSRKLAFRMFPEESGEKSRQRFLAGHAFVYSSIGLVLFIFGLRNLALVGCTFWLTLSQIGIRWDYFWDEFKYDLVGSLLYLLVGTALFFGGHGLVRIWSRLRYSGLRRQMGLCVRCGYDLTGNMTGTCPECGTPTTV